LEENIKENYCDELFGRGNQFELQFCEGFFEKNQFFFFFMLFGRNIKK